MRSSARIEAAMAVAPTCGRRSSPRPAAPSSVLMEGLPDELAYCILARLPCALQAQLRLVSRAWNAALHPVSGAITSLRSSLAISEAWPLLQSPDKHWFLLDPLLRRLRPIPIPLHLCSRFHDMSPAGSERCILVTSEGGIPHHGMYWLDVLRMQWHYAPSPTAQPYYVEGNESMGKDFASAIVNGYLYVSGGGDGERSVKSAERWHVGFTDRSSWERLPDMHRKRIWARGLVFQGCFCVVGGYKASSGYEELAPVHSGEVWNPETRQWTLVPQLWPSDVFGDEPDEPELAVVMGRLFALKHYAREILYYEETTQQWIKIGRMPTDPSEKFYGQCKLLGVGCELWLVVYTWDGRDRLKPRPDVKVFTAAVTSVSQPLMWKSSHFNFEAGSKFLGTVVYV